LTSKDSGSNSPSEINAPLAALMAICHPGSPGLVAMAIGPSGDCFNASDANATPGARANGSSQSQQHRAGIAIRDRRIKSDGMLAVVPVRPKQLLTLQHGAGGRDKQ